MDHWQERKFNVHGDWVSTGYSCSLLFLSLPLYSADSVPQHTTDKERTDNKWSKGSVAQFTCSSQKSDFSRHGKPVHFFFPADRSRNCCCYHQTANSTLIIITLVDVNGPSLCYLIYKSDLQSVPVAQVIRYIFINIPVNNKTHTTETGNTSWIYCTYQTLHRGKNQEKSDTHYTADFVKNNNCFVCLIKSLHHAFPIVKLIKGFCPRKEAAFTECLQFTKQPKSCISE